MSKIILTTSKVLKQFVEGKELQKQKDWFNDWIKQPGKRAYVQLIIDTVFNGAGEATEVLEYLYERRDK